MKNMLNRALRAALLNRAVYREVSEDPAAILHTTGIVILVGIGLAFARTGVSADSTGGLPDLASISTRLFDVWVFVITMMVSWVLWVTLTYILGSRFLGGGAGFRTLLRAIGICYGPGLLMIARPVPTIGLPIYVIGLVWMMVSAVMAVHEMQDLDWVSAILATLLGWFLFLVFLPIFVLQFLAVGS